jgi:hypothetical protein
MTIGLKGITRMEDMVCGVGTKDKENEPIGISLV